MNPPPTRIRHWVVVLAVTLAVITYIDRVCISQAAPFIEAELHFNKEQMSWVFSAFTLAYSLFEIPGGWLGDRIGPRRVLMRVVVCWSAFTAATGWAWNLASMIVCRFLFGIGEAGCFPNLTKIFTVWLPQSERERAQGIMWLSARWGGAFTPLLVVAVLGLVHWRVAFAIFGALGLVWAVWFYLWFRDRPADHPGVGASELALLADAARNAPGHEPIPWRRYLRSGTVWLLWLQYFCLGYGWYFYITWLPTYLREARGLNLTKGALLAGLPLFLGGIGCLVGGVLSNALARRLGGVAAARRLVASLGLFAAAILLVASTRIQGPVPAMILLGLASFATDLAMPATWAACMDVGGRGAGSLSGSVNMMGNLGGAVGTVVVAQILKRTDNNWSATFWVTSGFFLLGAVAWRLLDPVTPLDRAERAEVSSPTAAGLER
jgi:MFS family permease